MKVPTPVDFGSDDQPTKEELTKVLKHELNLSKRWTVNCTGILVKVPKVVWEYDRLEYFLGFAFGNDSAKILLNPVQVLCYHPKCLEKEADPVMLQVVCDLYRYIVHLRKHHSNDEVGKSMDNRFSTVLKNIFKTKYDGASPFSYIDPYPRPKPKTEDIIRRYGISRDFANITYVLHWKERFIRNHLIPTESLAFQEDDAFISLILEYPKPVHDWGFWRTLACYSMKMYTGVSGTGLNLLRGTTNYQLSFEEFVEGINHPCASISTVQRWLPVVNYENDQFHRFYLMFHLQVLCRNLSSILIKTETVRRYPVCLSVDEQEINQGTFVEDSVLHGLKEKLDAQKLQDIHIRNLAGYIKSKAPFVNAVREYRLMDLDGIFFSNVFTSFIAGSLNSKYCIDMLHHVAKLASSCFSCLESDVDCVYDDILDQCVQCCDSGRCCTSLVVFHIVWDMGSFHKKSAINMKQITPKSTGYEFKQRLLYSISFGGLHLAKAMVNAIRNHS